MLKKILISFTILAISLLIGASPAYGVNVPTFPSCSNPSGTLQVNYAGGTHGIVGSGATYTGSDAVYSTGNDTLIQCFCPDSPGNGIQTNWWKAASLSQEDIDVLKNQGWNYVPNGSLWGLENVPYVAKNSDYSCKGGVGGVAVEQALGLASMGDSMLVYGLAGAGVLLVFLGFVLRRTSN